MVETRSQKKQCNTNIENVVVKKRKKIIDMSDSEPENDSENNSEVDENGNLKDFIDDSDLKKKIKKIVVYDINNIENELEDCTDDDDSYSSSENSMDVDDIYKYTQEEEEYIDTLSIVEKEKLETTIEQLKNEKSNIPLKIKILLSNMDITVKKIVFDNYITLLQLSESPDSSYCKLKKWFDALMMIPFGLYKNIDISKEKNTDIEINNYLINVKKCLDASVYGHKQTKVSILEIVSQWISNPTSIPKVIALKGSPGTGKTSIVRDGLSKALNIPMGTISLGGARDGSVLDGHVYTWEGSSHGRLVGILQETKCMNPILYFDEVDKISDTEYGKEISGILIHLTDASQNYDYEDKYFAGIKLDLSKCLVVFSFNKLENIDPILHDRMTIINVDDYKIDDKIIIAKKYLIPKIIDNIGIKKEYIIIKDNVISYLINKLEKENGVRKLKQALETIMLKINLYSLIIDKNELDFKIDNFKYPMEITTDIVNNLLVDTKHSDIPQFMYL
jgi:ATP-dependent Lon protease